jgi:hypothetical protein
MLRPVPRLLPHCLVLACVLGGCKDPPAQPERVPPPKIASDEDEALEAEAYREALERALPEARAALIAADPLAAWRVGLAPEGWAAPPLSPARRRELERVVEPARAALAEIDESYLPGAEVVILRLMRFAFARLNDDLHRRPRIRQDPMLGLHEVGDHLDELRYRLVHGECERSCEALPGALADEVQSLRRQLRAASIPAVEHAAGRARSLADEARSLAAKPAASEREQLRSGLEQLARACEEHGAWLTELAARLPDAPQHQWSAKPAAKPASEAEIRRLPAILGAGALIRRLSVEERVDLVPGPAFAEIERHVGRWQSLRAALVGEGDPLADDAPAPVDLARCEAALERLRAGLEAVPEVDAPELDCARYLAVLGDEARSEAQLVLELLDLAVIEPQRRALRAKELPEVALVSGSWSRQVHTHLRRVMLLARLSEPAASALALREGRRALCWAEAALWIHAQLGPPEDVALTVGGPCVDLGEAEAITARVTGDPRGALAGVGLSLIGDEPARMVGFDRFFWAPLGMMKMLSTPKGMHPDTYSLPDDPAPAPEPEVDLKLEPL